MEKLILCPVCGKKLYGYINSYMCENKHTYDISKEGYVNFVLCNAKNSKQPGDSKEMMIARRNFLSSNGYKPLLDKIIEIIRENVKDGVIVEAGCGEGYYISEIQKVLTNFSCYGFDISKDAIKMASKRNKDVKFFVSSSYKTNIAHGTINCLLVVFAPFCENEFYNITNKDSTVIVVKPNYNHLIEMRNEFYGSVEGSKESKYSKFKLVKSYNVSYDMYLSKEQTINLFMMTPFYHQIGVTKQKEFIDNPIKTPIHVDFLIEVLKN